MNSPTAGIAPSCATADAIRLDDVSFGYDGEQTLRHVSLSIPRGAFVTLLGPSGCGKTTLLKLIGGYLLPSHGRIQFEQRDVTLEPPHSRDVGMVFQSYALFPHLTVRKNVAFGLEVRGVAKQAIRDRCEEVLDRVGLATELRDRLPAKLSGGQQQRVALARALAFGPSILLLDEPLASLDRYLREQLRSELRAIHRASEVSTLMVTHDQEEALSVSDYVGVMRAGRLIQFGPPQELYARPNTRFVAQILGDANFIRGEQIGERPGGLILIRPEHVRLGAEFPGQVLGVSYHGASQTVEVQCHEFRLKLLCPADVRLQVGTSIHVDIPRRHCWEVPDEDETL